jgi:hypothetical protein
LLTIDEAIGQVLATRHIGRGGIHIALAMVDLSRIESARRQVFGLVRIHAVSNLLVAHQRLP